MRSVLVAGLTATTMILGTGPALAAPYDWHETPTGLKTYLPYSIDSGGTALWTVGAFDHRDGFQPVAANWDGKGRCGRLRLPVRRDEVDRPQRQGDRQ